MPKKSISTTKVDNTSEEEKNNDLLDLETLLANDVRYSIVSSLDIFKNPLNLHMLTQITGFPKTTLIDHLSILLKTDFIKIKKIEGKRGKFYYLTEKFTKIKKSSRFYFENDDVFEKLEESSKLTTNEFRQKVMNDYQKQIESNQLNNAAAGIISLAMFNKSIATISSEYLKSCSEFYKNNKILPNNIPITDYIGHQVSLHFSSMDQITKFKKIYYSFLKEIISFEKKINLENEKVSIEDTQKVYLYFFTSPIINIYE